jgi:nucleoid-associated protein YgaU
MSKIIFLFILIASFSITGCSSSKNSLEKKEQEWGDSEFEDEEVASNEDDFEDDDELALDEDRAPSSEDGVENGSLELGEEGEYTVQKGDTLMQISFKLYGDFSKWKSIASLNPGAENALVAGDKIKVVKASEPFVWQPSGLPYLIQSGDTLGKISNDKYGTPKKWKNIYENNKPLIKDPNKIYAGFTIYYEEEEAVSAL